ncbi:uracil-DNA glycosylase [Cyclobacterium jeungdonense]|uniref:Uracil-DNA glycosylase n=1 Tax=Cyclobacterium jeungdonense TaxID=708087 RepID=A0ABT8CDY8_9BACT|nr:uracil-DNA glycosylase [Cyclobacterium jeungdonense]MDN3690003.1 uracil-DNA glycosylase [Cyclobacterium jeungdonense]
MDVKIENSWKELLQDEFSKPYFESLANFIKQEYQTKTIYPKGSHIFNAFEFCPVDQTKVVILGQDPYHGPGQAHGLSFSVQEGIPFPPSLLNIFKELKSDLGLPFPSHGNLEKWAKQGVLLLNATLTVEAHKAGSHQNKGWEMFTDKVVETLANRKENIVFLLWGAYAQKKAQIISDDRHLKLHAPHPSPLSAHRGFLGCKHFSQANAYLEKSGLTSIKW